VDTRRNTLVLVLAAGTAAVALTASPPANFRRAIDARPILLRPALAKTLTKPFFPLVIDLYWLKALNTIGERDSEEKNRGLYDFARILTDSDPRFYTAYTYLGLTIPFWKSRTFCANADLASDLFRRGLVVFPDDMRLHLYLGFTLFNMERKFKEASEVFARASRLKDALSFMAPLATRLLAHSGDAKEAVVLAQTLADSATDDATREELQGRVQDLQVEAQLQELDTAVDAYRAQTGLEPTSIQQVVERGLFRGPLQDVKGGTISIGADHKATSTSLDRRIEIYE
jgi:hypothetical protein